MHFFSFEGSYKVLGLKYRGDYPCITLSFGTKGNLKMRTGALPLKKVSSRSIIQEKEHFVDQSYHEEGYSDGSCRDLIKRSLLEGSELKLDQKEENQVNGDRDSFY